MNESTEYTQTRRLAGASFRLGGIALFMLLIIGYRAGYLILGRAPSGDRPSFHDPTQEEVIVWSVVEDICLVVAIVASVAALVLGIVALVRIRRGAGKVEWRGRAVSGVVTASLTLLTPV